MNQMLMSVGLAFALAGAGLLPAGAQTPAALTGPVTSGEEGPMEGVLVSAKKAGSTVTITVVSDAQGNYSFPAAKLEPGQSSLRIGRSDTISTGRLLRSHAYVGGTIEVVADSRMRNEYCPGSSLAAGKL